MTLAIIGSKLLIARDEVRFLVGDMLDKYSPTLVISGGAPGVDTTALEVARARGIAVKAYPAKRKVWAGPGGFKERNMIIAETCDVCIRIACVPEHTYGSGWTRDYAASLGKSTENLEVPV